MNYQTEYSVRNMSPEDFQRMRREILIGDLFKIKNAEERGDWETAKQLLEDMHSADSWMRHQWSLRNSPDAQAGLPDLGYTTDRMTENEKRFEDAMNREISKYLDVTAREMMFEKEKAAEEKSEKESAPRHDFAAFMRGLMGDDSNNAVQFTRKSASKNKSQIHKELPQDPPVTGAESVLALGYGPISTDYDLNNPKGLWEKVKNREVIETYHDGFGSSFRRNNTPFADRINGAIEAVKNQNAVFGNAGPNGKETVLDKVSDVVNSTKVGSDAKNAIADTVIKKSATRREADDKDFATFFSAFRSAAEKTAVPESTLKIPTRSVRESSNASNKTSSTGASTKGRRKTPQ